MAPLTWRNVQAPDYSAAASILNTASNQLSSGFDGLGGLFGKMDTDQINAKSADALGQLAGVRSESDVDRILGQVLQSTRPEDRNTALNTAIANLRGTALGYDTSRMDMSNTASLIDTRAGNLSLARNQDNRVQKDWDWGYDKRAQSAQLGRDYAHLVGPGGAPASLIINESGGNPRAANNAVGSSGLRGHVGYAQIGQDRLTDMKNAGIIPKDMTLEQYGASDKAQEVGNTWHFRDIHNFIEKNGLTKHLGKNYGGTTITYDGMIAVANLGGQGGLRRYLESGGVYDPADDNGTHLSTYAKRHAGNTTDPRGQGQPNIQNTGIADLLPEDSKFSFDEILGMVDRRRQDATYATSQNEAAQRQQAQGMAYEMLQGLVGPNAKAEAKDRVLNSDMSPQQKNMILQEIDNVFDGNQDFNSPREGATNSLTDAVEQASEIVSSMQDGFTDWQNRNGIDDGALNATPGSSGSGGTGGAGGAEGTLPDQMGKLSGDVEASQNDIISDSKVFGTVQRLSEETGLDADFIMQFVPNSLNQGGFFGGKTVVDEDILRRHLQPFVAGKDGQSEYVKIQSQTREHEKNLEKSRNYETKLKKLENENSILARRNSPEAQKKIRENEEESAKVLTQLLKLQSSSSMRPGNGQNTQGGGGRNIAADLFDKGVEAVTGSGAITPNTAPVDREQVAADFGQGVRDRGATALDRAAGLVASPLYSFSGAMNDAGGALLSILGDTKGAARAEARSDSRYNQANDAFSNGLNQVLNRNQSDFDREPGMFSPDTPANIPEANPAQAAEAQAQQLVQETAEFASDLSPQELDQAIVRAERIIQRFARQGQQPTPDILIQLQVLKAARNNQR